MQDEQQPGMSSEQPGSPHDSGQEQFGPPGYQPYYPPPPPPRKKPDQTTPVVAVITITCVVVFFIGIISTVAIPLLLSARNNAVNEKARNCLRTVVSAETAFFAHERRYGDVDELVDAGYLDSRFKTGDFGNDIVCGVTLDEDQQGFDATVTTPTQTYTIDESSEIECY